MVLKLGGPRIDRNIELECVRVCSARGMCVCVKKRLNSMTWCESRCVCNMLIAQLAYPDWLLGLSLLDDMATPIRCVLLTV